MVPIRTLLLDDEHFALALLENYAARIPDIQVIGALRSPILAVEKLQAEAVDLLVLDIQMPVLSGTNLVRSISHKPAVIFTTAYSQFATEAFDLDAVDYLLKPFTFERFEHAVGKARDFIAIRKQSPEKISQPEGFLTVRADRRMVRIPFLEIQCIEGWKEYVKIFYSKEKVITLESLNNLEDTLPAGHFFRVHKSYIIGRHAVRELDAESIALSNGMRVPVARARKKMVVEWLGK